jgi:branched-chain amino acid transport system substrate-binding protein
MRISSLGRVTLIGVVGALALTACSNASTSSGGSSGGLAATSAASGSGAATGGTVKIAFQGPLSGDNQQLGINEVNAVRLAVEEANTKGELGFTTQLVEADDVGAPATAPPAAAKILQDPAVLGVIGPSFSGATKAVGKTYGDAGVATITPSATNATLQDQGFTTYHRIVPDDNVEGTQAAEWFARKGLKNVFIVDDLSDYGKGVSDAVEAALKTAGVSVTRQGVDAKTTDYSPIATQVQSSGAEAIFYGGYDAQASQFAKALKSAGFTGLTVTGNGGKSSVFTDGAGDAGNGWYFTCGCLDATIAPDAKAFADAYQAKFNTPPSTYSPEAYDATNTLLQAIKDASASGAPTRASVLEAVNKVKYSGITAEIAFQENGELETVPAVSLYQQEAGAIKSVGLLKDQN